MPRCVRLPNVASTLSKAYTMSALRLSFVCTGNICRSPTAHWVMVSKLKKCGLEGKVEVVSSGTHGHVGWSADKRSELTAARRGFDLSRHRAAALQKTDFHECSLLFALDSGHYDQMKRVCPKDVDDRRVRMLMEFGIAVQAKETSRGGAAAVPSASRSKTWELDVPDPYYEDDHCFEDVFDMIDAATDGILVAVQYALSTADPGSTLLLPATELLSQAAAAAAAAARR